LFPEGNIMTAIPNFPDDLLHQHHKWHMPAAHPELPPTRLHPAGSTGSGDEFLTFHRDFMAQVLAWYSTMTFTADPFDQPSAKAALVAPWISVPAEMRNLQEWNNWANDSARLDSAVTAGPTRPSDFGSSDQLGIFIELGIHNNFLHGAAADAYDDEIVRSPMTSPGSTLFYKIHGLVQHWWAIWARRYALRGSPASTFDPNRPLRRWSREVTSPTLDPDRQLPSVSAQLSPSELDVQEIDSLIARVRRLEERAFPMIMTLASPNGHREKRKAEELERKQR